jgi:hypothetical protein
MDWSSWEYWEYYLIVELSRKLVTLYGHFLCMCCWEGGRLCVLEATPAARSARSYGRALLNAVAVGAVLSEARIDELKLVFKHSTTN